MTFCADFPHLACLRLRQRDQGLEAVTSWRRQLKSLCRLTTLQELHLHSVTGNCSPLSALTHLKALTIRYCHSYQHPPPDEAFVSVLCHVTHLQLNECPRTSAAAQLRSLRVVQPVCPAGLWLLSQLTRLDLDYAATGYSNALTELSTVYLLTNLRHLCLRIMYMDTVAGFTALSGLTALKLDTQIGNLIYKLGSLRAWTALRHLTCRWSKNSVGYGQRVELVRTRDSSGICVKKTDSGQPTPFCDFFGDPDDCICLTD